MFEPEVTPESLPEVISVPSTTRSGSSEESPCYGGWYRLHGSHGDATWTLEFECPCQCGQILQLSLWRWPHGRNEERTYDLLDWLQTAHSCTSEKTVCKFSEEVRTIVAGHRFFGNLKWYVLHCPTCNLSYEGTGPCKHLCK